MPAVFNVKPHLRPGENELVVRLTVGSELAKDGAPHPEQNLGANHKPAVPGEIPNTASVRRADQPLHAFVCRTIASTCSWISGGAWP